MSNHCSVVAGGGRVLKIGVASAAGLIASWWVFAGRPVGRDFANQRQMESWWVDLEKDDVKASRALLNLYEISDRAIPFLKDKLKPLKIGSGRVKTLLLKLNSADECLWKSAFEELEYFDPRLAIELTELRKTWPPGMPKRGRRLSPKRRWRESIAS
jgi:hypothetical protein